MMVDRQISVGKQYVCDVDAFLRGKDVEDYKELALARDLWAGYCAGEARLTNDDEELAYWSKQQNLLTSGTDVLAGYLQPIDFNVFLQCIELDSATGLDVNNSMLSNKEQFERFDHTMDNMDVLSNNDQFKTVFERGTEMINMNEGISQTFNLDQMIQNVLVVEATDGPMPQTRDHILLP